MFESSWNARAKSEYIAFLAPKIREILKNQKSVLDVWCTNGWLLHYLDKTVKYTGLSYSQSDIDVIKSKWHEAYLVNLDKETIPLADESVDCIFASHILEHFEKSELIALMNELRRVLKKGGVIILITPTDYNPFFYAEWTHIKPFNHGSLPWLLRDFEFTEVDWMYPKLSFFPKSLQALLRFPLFFLKPILWKEVVAYGKK